MWVIETLNETVEAELNSLPADMRARFEHVCDLIKSFGLTNVGEPHVKPLEDKLWEMRMSGQDGIARAIYVTAKGRRVVVLRVFIKKTQKTPRRELNLASDRYKTLVEAEKGKPAKEAKNEESRDGQKRKSPDRKVAGRSRVRGGKGRTR